MPRDLGVQRAEDKPYYFVSFDSCDKETVRHYAVALSEIGIPIWYDEREQTRTGQNEKINEKIKNCQAVVMFLSKNVLENEETCVYTEYRVATAFAEKKVYFVMLERIVPHKVPHRYWDWWVDVIDQQVINAYEYKTAKECAGKLVVRFDD